MKFRVLWHPQAVKALEKLPRQVSERIIERISLVSDEPFRFVERLVGEEAFKLRIGDYRALITIDTKEGIIQIEYVDHRSRIYKR